MNGLNSIIRNTYVFTVFHVTISEKPNSHVPSSQRNPLKVLCIFCLQRILEFERWNPSAIFAIRISDFFPYDNHRENKNQSKYKPYANIQLAIVSFYTQCYRLTLSAFSMAFNRIAFIQFDKMGISNARMSMKCWTQTKNTFTRIQIN